MSLVQEQCEQGELLQGDWSQTCSALGSLVLGQNVQISLAFSCTSCEQLLNQEEGLQNWKIRPMGMLH